MSGRRCSIQVPCAIEGCPERSRWEYTSYKSRAESFEWRAYMVDKKPWKCCRHSHGDGVLTVYNRRFVWESKALARSERFPELPDMFWGAMGVVTGPGFYASSKDFPAGTKIRVTAEVLLP